METRKIIAVDTEGWHHLPWCTSFAIHPYEGFVVKATDHEGLGEVQRLFNDADMIVLHNSLHDIGVLRAMGLTFDDDKLHDTMIQSYLLGLEPQGLKPLAYRHMGMIQSDFSDIVAIPSAMHAEAWLDALVEALPIKLPPPKKPKKGQPAPPPAQSERDMELGRVRKLIEAMLRKNEPMTLRTRWAACRSREILAEELDFLSPYAADPPEATLDDVSDEVSIPYAGRDADATLRIHAPLSANIDAMGLRDAYTADIAIVPMIDRMQTVGLAVDLDHFQGLIDVFEGEVIANAEEIRRLAGGDVNVSSGDQVAEWLFDRLRLHLDPRARHLRIKATGSGKRLSTNDKILEALSPFHPAVGLVQEGREIRKMLSTYARPMPLLVSRTDGRLHPRYRLTRVESGRVSASDPNVLALPKHSRRGKLIREGIIAGPGMVLSEWDLDQIEMRVFAHDSGDEVMLAAFASGRDLHATAAVKTSGMTYEEIYEGYKKYKAGDESFAWADEKRFAGKAINFGTLMGITEYGLLDQMHKNGQLHWTIEMSHDELINWNLSFPQGAAHISNKHAEARRYGFVRDMFGRLRWLEGIHSTDKYIRQEAERQAQATPTQSGAAGIIKRGMARLWPLLKAYRAGGMPVECLLWVHDALILEHRPEDTEELNDAVMFCLCNAVELKIPVTAKGKLGVTRLSDL